MLKYTTAITTPILKGDVKLEDFNGNGNLSERSQFHSTVRLLS